jgi:hypothetical protein
LSRSFGCLSAITLFWCALTGTFLVITGGNILRHVDAQRRFQKAEGTVLSSQVERKHGRRGTTHYKPRIVYRYRVGGTEHVSDRFTFDDSTSSSAEGYARRVVDDHPIGKRLAVYYDPERPEVAILDLPIPSRLWFTILFLQPFLTLGVGMAWGVGAHFPEKRRIVRFLADPPAWPWRIPTWGEMRTSDFTLSIEHRPSVALQAVGVYVLTSFLAMIAAGFTGLIFGEGFFETPGWTVAAAFAVSLALAILGGRRLAAKRRRTVTVDRKARTLTVGSRSIPFDDLKELRVWRPLRPTKKGSEPGDPQLSAILKDDQAVELHDFQSPWKADEIARKAGDAVADALGLPLKAQS